MSLAKEGSNEDVSAGHCVTEGLHALAGAAIGIVVVSAAVFTCVALTTVRTGAAAALILGSSHSVLTGFGYKENIKK